MKNNKASAVFLLLLFGLNSLYLNAQDNASAVLKIKKSIDFKVTGNGSSDNWNSADWIDIPERRSSVPGEYTTKAKVLYSDKGIYFLFDCVDKKITATLKADNLKLYEEDVVEVFLWTSEDFPVYFEYELSPLNYELPIMVPNYKGKFFGWLPWQYEGDKKTHHATSVRGGKKKSGKTISGWMAEIFIPYKLLDPLNNVPPVSGTKWRANMYRIDYDHGSGATFSWQKTKPSFHDYNSFGTFEFE